MLKHLSYEQGKIELMKKALISSYQPLIITFYYTKLDEINKVKFFAKYDYFFTMVSVALLLNI